MCKCLMIQQLSHSSCEIRVNFVLQPFNKSFKFEPKKFHYYLKRIKLSSQETIRCYFTVFFVCVYTFAVCLSGTRSWLDRELRQGLVAGQTWYLISMAWWKQYVDYIGWPQVCVQLLLQCRFAFSPV